MKTYTLIFIVSFSGLAAQAQSLVGKWQLMNQTTCMEDELEMDDAGVEDVVSDMQRMSSRTPQVIHFKSNNSGSETTKVLSKKRSYNAKSFFYKFDGTNLFILDKKSRTILESFTIETFNDSNLIISNSTKPCETKVFVKIK